MKLHIDIEMSDSEFHALLAKLGQSPPLAVSESESQTAREEKPHIVRVVDNEMNQKSEFWKARIGWYGRVVEERGGMWDVSFLADPFPCKDIDPQRFAELTM
jgi:hypothetical protein